MEDTPKLGELSTLGVPDLTTPNSGGIVMSPQKRSPVSKKPDSLDGNLQDTIEERGVVRERNAPRGYVVYSAIAFDGTIVMQYQVLKEVETAAGGALATDRMWDAIERYEAMIGSPRCTLTLL